MHQLSASEILELLTLPPPDLAKDDDEIDEATFNLLHQHRRALRSAHVKQLKAALRSTQDIDLGAKICYYLGRKHARSAVPLLIDYLKHPSRDLRMAASDALMKIGDARAGEALFRLFISEEDLPMKTTLALALGSCMHEAAIPALIEAVEGSDASLRNCAAFALGRLRAVEAKQAIEEALLHEESSYIMLNMVHALRLIEGETEDPSWCEAAKHRTA